MQHAMLLIKYSDLYNDGSHLMTTTLYSIALCVALAQGNCLHLVDYYTKATLQCTVIFSNAAFLFKHWNVNEGSRVLL